MDTEWKPSSLADIAAMVVDDDPVITSMVKITLKAIGLGKIYTINDSRQAMDFLAEGVNGVQLVICDMEMPDVNGLEVLEQARKDYPNLPFLMLTANRSPEAVSQAANMGVSGYMAKPVQPKEVEEKVRHLIQRNYGALPTAEEFEFRR
jgi:two-component system, chemotaxis family, chemotaxis protein CheY